MMPQNLSNPYVGPRTFLEEDKAYFFGRDKEAHQLLSRVKAERLVLFYAQSGAGKSSLINTRLRPELAAEDFHVLPTVRVGGTLPEGITEVDNIFVFNLITSLETNLENASRLTQTTLKEYFQTIIAQTTEIDEFGEEKARALIIDQFEEIVTTNLDRWEERELFFQQLAEAMIADPLLFVVLSMREDHVASIEPYARFLPGGMRKRYYMQRMKADAALQAIIKPARKAKRPFTTSAAEQLVNNLCQLHSKSKGKTTEQSLGEFVEPVQLQVVCFQLWQNLNAQADPPAEISNNDLSKYGDVDEALSNFYESVITDVLQEKNTYESELTLRMWFENKLITKDGTRDSAYQDSKTTEGLSNDTVLLLADKYLLRSESRAGGIWFELIHDRFVDPILEANQKWRERQNLLIQSALDWNASGRPESKLLVGSQLQTAKENLGDGHIDPVLTDYLAECEKADTALKEKEANQQREFELERGRVKAFRTALIVSGSFLILAVFFAIIAFEGRGEAVEAQAIAEDARNEAEEALIEAEIARATAEAAVADAEAKQNEAEAALDKARARLHIEQAREVHPGDPLLGMRLALEGLNLLSDDEGMSDVTRNLIRTGWVDNLGEKIASLTVHPENSLLFILENEESQSEIWHANDNEPLTYLTDPIEKVTFTNDGTHFIIDYPNGPGEIHSTEDDTFVEPFTAEIENLFFSPQSTITTFIVNYEEGPAEVWDSGTGEKLITLVDDISEIIFNPETSIFIVDYLDSDIPDELRAVDGSQLVQFDAPISDAYPFYPGAQLFSVEYGFTDLKQLRWVSDGSIFEPSESPISDITFHEDVQIFVVEYENSETPVKLIGSDGITLVSLEEIVFEVIFDLETQLFVVDYLPLNLPDEVRRTTDGTPLVTLEGDILDIAFNAEAERFVVDYISSNLPDEVRHTSDGSALSTLENELNEVIFNSETQLFIVDYSRVDLPDEIRHTADGTLLATLANNISTVEFSPDGSIFLVDYRDPETPDEIRLTSDGTVLTALPNPLANLIFSPDSETLLFSTQYIDNNNLVTEIRQISTGEEFPLNDEVDEITISSDANIFFVNYLDPEIPDELRNMTDGDVITSLEMEVADLIINIDPAVFVIDYEDPELPGELRRTSDAEILIELSKPDVSHIRFNGDREFLVVYYEDQSADIYRNGSYQLEWSFSQVRNIVFDNDNFDIQGNPLPATQLTDDVTDELGDTWFFHGQAGDIITLDMQGNFDTVLGLVNSDGDNLASNDVYDGDYLHSRIEDYRLPYSGVYTIIAKGYSSDIGSYTLTVEGINLSLLGTTESGVEPPAAATFVVYFADSNDADLWAIDDDQVVASLTNIDSFNFSPDLDKNVFEVIYSNGSREIHRTADDSLVTRLGATISNIIFNNMGTSFIVLYADGAVDLFRTSDGELLTRLSGSIIENHAEVLSPQGNASIFGLRYVGESTQLYSSIDGKRITELPGDAYDLTCSPQIEANICIVSYTDRPGEIRDAETGERLEELPDIILDITFSRNPQNGVFIIEYKDGTAELRQTADGELLAAFTKEVSNYFFSPNQEETFLFVNYRDESAELYLAHEGQPLRELPGTVSNAFFSPDETLLFVNYNNETAELYQSADGALLEQLRGVVKESTRVFNEDVNIFVLDYIDSNIPDEIRSLADGHLLEELTGPVIDTKFSSDPEATLLSLRYFDTPPEIRHSLDGSLLITLTVEIDGEVIAPDELIITSIKTLAEAAIFVVNYDNFGLNEVRRTSDGTLVASFMPEDDIYDIVLSPNPEAAIFGVQYDDMPSEIHQISNSEEFPLTGEVDNIIFSPDSILFFVEYLDDLEIPNEIRNMVDGEPLITGFFTTTFSTDTPHFVVDYFDPEIPDELHSTENSAFAVELDGEFSNLIFNTAVPFFVVKYEEPDILDTLFSTTDRSIRTSLAGKVSQLIISPDPAVFLVDYEDTEIPAELRAKEDAETLIQLSKSGVSRMRLNTSQEFLVVYYDDHSADIYHADGYELERIFRQVSDIVFDNDNLTTELQGVPLPNNLLMDRVTDSSGDVWTFNGQSGDIITLDMKGDFDTYLVLADSMGDTLTYDDDYNDNISHSRIIGYRLPYSGVFAIITRGYSGDTGSYTLAVEGVRISFSDDSEDDEIPGATTYAVYFADDSNSNNAAVWSIYENQELTTREGVSSISFIYENLFLVEYSSGNPELFYKDKSLATGFIDLVESTDADTTYLVALYDDKPGEIFLRANGEKVATFPDEDEVTEATFYGEDNIYLVVKYSDDHIEVWDMEDEFPKLLVDLGIGIDSYFVDTHNQRLVVLYDIGNVYLVDLMLVEALSEVLDQDSSAEDLLNEACTYLFPPGTFDEARLIDYLEGNEPQACRP